MDGRRLENAGEQVVPKAFDLHVFAADQSEVDQHVCADQQLHDAPCIFVLPQQQKQSERDRDADVTEIEQIKYIVFRQPERDGDCLKHSQHGKRQGIFFHGLHLTYILQIDYSMPTHAVQCNFCTLD